MVVMVVAAGASAWGAVGSNRVDVVAGISGRAVDDTWGGGKRINRYDRKRQRPAALDVGILGMAGAC